MLLEPCNTLEDKKALINGVYKVQDGFDFAWKCIDPSRKQYWYPGWCENLNEVLCPGEHFGIESISKFYRAKLIYMHGEESHVTAWFLFQLFKEAGFDVSFVKVFSEYEDEDEDE
jgi:hypothetical protein